MTYKGTYLKKGFSTNYETNRLLIGFVKDYVWIWNDSGSGADRDASFWRPMPPSGWYRVGHYVKEGHEKPTEYTLIVKEKTGGVLKAPVNYKRIWTDAGSGADDDLAVWHPVCPNGYQALGDVATDGGKPSADEVRCLPADELTKAISGDFVWNDAGSGADDDFSAWSILAPSEDNAHVYLNHGLFYG